MTQTVLIDPARPKYRIRPLKALRHFRNLIANKEDTEQVFHIITALSGKSFENALRRFMASKKGHKRYAERTALAPMLDDHETILKFSEGSVGQAYVHFMRSQGLSASGLVAEFESFATDMPQYDDAMEWYGNRSRDLHDLYHILTGYSRDALGEASVLGFTHGQNQNLGAIFIAYAAAREIKKSVPKGTPTYSSVRQGVKIGEAALPVIQEDIIALLAENLEDARKRLNIGTPSVYFNAHDMMTASGIDPYGTLSPAQ
ncbi:Coq4 family protein [Robiginitomaculum antarcticum]|uniref:Coq4 family protein n=1 Tax=Robiginitomaculum antarcticum TaxID=437507 RepID=UPI0003654F73|nr:Coq4 family protein [Robiginitomaculum antarcticum]